MEKAGFQGIYLAEHDSVGIIIPIKNERSQFIVGCDTTLYLFSWEPETKETLMAVGKVDIEKTSNQFNDGKVDSDGRLWIGKLEDDF